MTTRTFAATTVQDAFRRVRAKLGDRAVILDVRHLGGRVEVVAGVERPRGLRRILEQGGSAARVKIGDEDDVDPDELIPLHVLTGPGGLSRPFSRALALLELPPDLAARISGTVGDGPGAFRRLEAYLERTHPIPDPVPDPATGVIAVGFLGGRGVGRSSLVRGLAARAAIQQPGRVIWLEAGFPARPVVPMPEMLAPLGVDHRVANHPYEIECIADEHQDVSAVLLDLPGIDVHRSGERKALQRYIRSCRKAWPSLSLHGTASAMWSVREAQRSLAAQMSLGATAAGWTWVDQAGDPGTILATALRISIAPSFFAGSTDPDGEEARAGGWDEVIEWLIQAAQLHEGLKS
jgi:hypothetical protein